MLRRFLNRQFIVALVSLTTWAHGVQSSGSDIELEGSVTEHDARISSSVNITCVDPYPYCGVEWWKDGKKLHENERFEWIQGVPDSHYVSECLPKKLVIRNVNANDKGTYKCVGLNVADFSKKRFIRTEHFLTINTVTCYQGYYCPSNTSTHRRCPTGRFSMVNNATSVNHCQLCPTNHRKDIRKEMDRKTAAIFETNCPADTPASYTSSILPTGGKIALGISGFVLVVCVVAVTRVLQRWKKSVDEAYEEKLFPKHIEYGEKPEIPPSNDVFVCYSSKNSTWVQDTLHRKLKSQGFQTLIDFIDFEVGVSIHENIVNAIYGSRKTLFVLSNDSLKSFYARRELHQALAAGSTGHQIIVIQYEKCKLPVEIIHMPYLDWSDEKKRDTFWQKLYDLIRMPLPSEIF